MAKTQKKYELKRCRNSETIRKLDRQLFPSDEGLSQAELKEAAWWVLWHRGEPVGFAGVSVFPTGGEQGLSGYLRRAGVARGHRGAGLQRRLIRVRDRWAKAQGATLCITYTSGDNFPSSNNLIACGYKLYDPVYRYGIKGGLYWIKYYRKPKAY